ncbi:MAG: HesA/MoeB/ThiF family protein [Gammaproteobacteria bacterium WSBS_2016_MAG_OTU1]
MDDLLLQRYSRHLLLEEFDVAGQQRLAEAKVLIVGAGGLGCPAALYLTAAGVGELTIYDDDQVDLTNLQRQVLHNDKRIGINKADSACQTLGDINPHCRLVAKGEKFTAAADCLAALAVCDVVVDCCDNYATRHLLNRLCVAHKKPLVFGAASGFCGQTAVFDSRLAESPCYHCLFCEEDDAEETPCALMGVFAPLVGVVGCLQAAAAIKLLAMPQLATVGNLLLIEARTMEMREVRVPKDPQCAVCGNKQ